MTRVKLPDRRPCVTMKVPAKLDSDREIHLLITVGFTDRSMTEPMEVFCADFKAGTALQSIIMDACIVISRLLQHGTPPSLLLASLCSPPSLLGVIVQAVINATRESVTP